MATDLERLVIQLSADVKGYENALKKASATTNRETAAMERRFQRMNKNVNSALAGASRNLATFAKGFVGAFGIQQLSQIARQAAAAGDAIGDLAEQTGASVESIQILRYAAQQTGASAEQMDTAIKKLAVNLGEAQKGSGDLAKLLKANGIALKDATGAARPFNDILNDIVELVRRAPDDFAALEVVTTAFGERNDELVTTFRNGKAGVKGFGDELQNLRGIIDQDGIDALGRLDAKYNETMVALEKATQRLVIAVGPMIEAILEEIVQFANTLGEIADTVRLLMQGEFAAAGRLAAHGPETAVEKTIRERRELEAQIAAIEEDRKTLQGEINVARQMGALTLDEETAKQKELNDLAQKELDLRKQLAAIVRFDIAPRAGRPGQAPVFPTEGATVIPTKPTTAPAATPTATTTRGGGMTTITTAGGLKATVAEAYADQFEGFLRELEASGYVITSLGGYNYRTIAGTNKLSQHAFGKAIDINPATNPYTRGPLVTDMPANVEEMAKRWGLAWGGAWKSVKDAMHFEADVLLGEEDLNAAIATANAIEEQYEQTLATNQMNWERYVDERAATTDATIARMDEMRSLAGDVFSGIVSDLRAGASAGEIFANVLDKIISKLADMAVQSLVSGLFGPAGTTSPGLLGSLLGGLFGAPAVAGARQHGGPVMGGSSYVVGEHGPEIFTPSVAGAILPNRGGQKVGVAISSHVAPSPFFIQTITAVTDQRIANNNRMMPAYLAERQRRGI